MTIRYACCIIATAIVALEAYGAPVSFQKEIAPVLERSCIRCHQDGNKKADLSLSSRKDIIENEYITPGNSANSPLLDSVRSGQNGKRPHMPKDGKALTDDEVKLLTRWIQEGAKWPADFRLVERAKADSSWWSLQPLRSAQPPKSATIPLTWSENPIDRFVYAKIVENKLLPSLPADARSLARRLSFDLTGLPLSPERLERFVQKPTVAEYEKLVDELLASPAYGEHWGRHWLDVVRFGESNGYERNVIINNAWPFRDYIIGSLNADKPYDQLVREHLVGDLISPGQADVEIGTGFLVCGPYDNVGNQDPVQAAIIRANTLDEMIRATGETFLGVTIGCVRCHNHKFDPITQQDYYRLYASLSGAYHGARVIAPARAIQNVETLRGTLATRLNRLKLLQSALVKSIQIRAERDAKALESKWIRPPVDPRFTEDHFNAIEAKQVRFTALARLDRPEMTNGFHLDEFEVWTAGPKSRNVALAKNGGRAEGESRKAEDFTDAYSPELTINGQYGAAWISAGPTLTITLAKPELISRVNFSANRTGVTSGPQFTRPFVGEYRIEVSLDGKKWKMVSGSHDRKPATPALRAHRLSDTAMSAGERTWHERLVVAIRHVEAEFASIPTLPTWWAGQFRPASGPFHVFSGGDPQKKADVVPFASPTFMSSTLPSYTLPATATESERRTKLAEWIVSPKNPLTPRVLANRVWQYHFGTGIVDTPSDFGYMGGRPTHPELLDWLAQEIIRNGWRLKPIHKLIVMSQTYQQTSRYRPDAAAIDGDSRLLWRYPPRRLSGEEVRDSLLSVAGKLNTRDAGGPGFRLYKYLEDNVATYVPLDTHGPDTYRRAVYHQNARAARVDLLTDFDCPDPAAAAPRRASTTTPLQALTLFNHQFTLDMAEAFAKRVQIECGSAVEKQVHRIYLLAYGREPTETETKASLTFITKHGLRAFCRAVLNSNEFLFVD